MRLASDVNTVKKRADFTAAASSQYKWIQPNLVMQWLPAENEPSSIGLTVTKKRYRKSVDRNRVKRRLRAAFQELHKQQPLPKGKLVCIARDDLTTLSYNELCGQIRKCLHHLQRQVES